MAAEGMRLVRIIGPQTAHRYHPDSKIEIDAHPRRDRRTRARCLSAQGAVHHLDAGLQPDEMGDHRRAGEALGARPPGRGDRRRVRGGGDAPPTSPLSPWRWGRAAAPLDAGGAAGGDDRRPEGDRAGAPVATARGPRASAKRAASGPRSRASGNPGCASATDCKGRSTTRSWTASSSCAHRHAAGSGRGGSGWRASRSAPSREWRRQFRGEAQVREDQRRSPTRRSPPATSCCGATLAATASWRGSPTACR